VTVASGEESFSLSGESISDDEQKTAPLLIKKFNQLLNPKARHNSNNFELDNLHLERGRYIPMLYG